jgi:hypothetical protein
MTATSVRRAAFIAGALYILTFIASIPTLAMKAPVVDHVDFVLGFGNQNSVIAASLMDIVCALAGIGTAVVLWPITKRENETLGLGFVTSRVLEAAILVVGAISLMAVVTLRNDVTVATGAEATSLITTARSLVALHRWSFLFGPGVMASVNALMFATLLYRSRLVPRIIPLVGLIGAPLLLFSSIVTAFGGWEQTSDIAMLLVLPIAAWEFTIGVWMMVKGFSSRTPRAVQSDVTALAAA